jgi:hypothetical protein
VAVPGYALCFSQADGVNGALRFAPTHEPARWSYWAYLDVGDAGFVIVRDDDASAPRAGALLEVRTDGLWAELVCEVPGVHWTFGLEAFGLRLADRDEARTAVVGERVPMGFDLEWDEGAVFGELLVARDRVDLDGRGTFLTEAAPLTWADWLDEPGAS